jgi:hypothetical protein
MVMAMLIVLTPMLILMLKVIVAVISIFIIAPGTSCCNASPRSTVRCSYFRSGAA